MSKHRLVIAGGGTGGHLFPGVAVAEEFLARHPEGEVLFVGTERGIESRILPGLGYELAKIEVSGLKTVGLLGALRGALRIPGALKQSRALLRDFAPTVVIGVGGYASGPVVLAAQRMGIPTAILEQNSVPGLTNRILGKFVDRIFLSFAHSQSYFKAKKSALVGNPIRRQILDGFSASAASHKTSDKDASNNDASDNAPPDALRLFIFGGSQGAVTVNQMCCQAARILSEEGVELNIVHQTGVANLDASKALYAEAGVAADCRAFIDNMADEYAKADLIVSRAGATTIAELGIAGVPTILIPYPYAANNHQELNAAEMVDAGAARMLLQSEDGGQKLAALIREMSALEVRLEMAQAMRNFARPGATATIVDWLDEQ